MALLQSGNLAVAENEVIELKSKKSIHINLDVAAFAIVATLERLYGSWTAGSA